MVTGERRRRVVMMVSRMLRVHISVLLVKIERLRRVAAVFS